MGKSDRVHFSSVRRFGRLPRHNPPIISGGRRANSSTKGPDARMTGPGFETVPARATPTTLS